MSALPERSVRQVVIQATPFCNIDCRYCYLADRADRTRLPMPLLGRMLAVMAEQHWTDAEVEFRWHAGEPLAAGLDFYREALPLCSALLSGQSTIVHSLQTNGMLITGEWIDLFRDHDVRVGVSIDGPASIHDQNRTTRSGGGTHVRVEQGVRLLQQAGMPFDVIAVVTTETLRNEAAFLDYFKNLSGMRTLGLNVEESEGAHNSEALGDLAFLQGFREFLSRLDAWAQETGVRVREFEALRRLILHADARTIRNSQNVPFAILGLSARGEIYTFSPELMGLSFPGYESFAIGHLGASSATFDVWMDRLTALEAEVEAGVAKCRSECAYYRMCGGGAPVNKLYENGSFASSATRQCSMTVMAVADVVMARMEADRGLSRRTS